MTYPSLPRYLVSKEILELLIKLLLELEELRGNIKVKNFGARVSDGDEAQQHLSRIKSCAREILGWDNNIEEQPELVLTRRLGKLRLQTLESYLFFAPIGGLLIYFAINQSLDSPEISVVFAGIVLLLTIPLILSRRTRLHVEHRCGYARDLEGRGAIVIDQLHAVQFHSYLAHEYGHHLFFSLNEEAREPWAREGWARLFQWHVVRSLSQQENDPVYLYHALLQIIGELKFACQIAALALHIRLPIRVRLIRTIFHKNSLFCLITGTPTFSPMKLLDHAVGTAVYLLAGEKMGTREALRRDPASLLDVITNGKTIPRPTFE
jgi:hypothetical protein